MTENKHLFARAGASGCTFVISFISYLYQYTYQGFSYCFKDSTENTGLGQDYARAFDHVSLTGSRGSSQTDSRDYLAHSRERLDKLMDGINANKHS